MWPFRRTDRKAILTRSNSSGLPPRRGKTRMDSRKVAPARRSSQQRIRKLRRSGWRMSSKKPAGQMSDTEWRKLESRVASGNYEVEVVVEPPVWKDEPPRERIMLRRKG